MRQEHSERLPRKPEEHRDAFPRTVEKFDAESPGRQSKYWAHKHCDSSSRKSAKLCERLPGQVEKIVIHEQKHVEKVVTHEQKKVEKVVTHELKKVEKVVTHEKKNKEEIVTGAHRVGGVLRQSNMAKQFHPVMHNMHKPCCTVDSRLECETRILNHEHVCSLSSLSKLTVTVDIAHTGKTRSRLVCLKFFFNLLMSINLSAGEFVFCAVSTSLPRFSAMNCLLRHQRVRGEISKFEITSRERVDVCTLCLLVSSVSVILLHAQSSMTCST